MDNCNAKLLCKLAAPYMYSSPPLERPPYGSQKSGLSRGVVFPQGEERPMKQAFVPRYWAIPFNKRIPPQKNKFL